jgi:prepilin-type N-terminal cleavage/methylation domain-containing protein
MTPLSPSKLRLRNPRTGTPLPRLRALPDVGEQGGFSLIEALVALFILTIIALGLGQVIGLGMLSNQAADDLTQATTLSADKLEELRASEYWALDEGGSLDTAREGYSDSPDIDGDGTAEFERRWQITDQTGGKRLEVRTLSLNNTIGNGRQATIATVVAER